MKRKYLFYTVLVIMAALGTWYAIDSAFAQSNINARFGTLDVEKVTATHTELNLLDGVTATTAELNILDGVTATYTEINYIDGTTLGTSIASKALGLGATKNTDSLTVDDYLKTAKVILGSTEVTSTGTELNILDGVTATYGELNYVDVTTAGAAQASKAIILDSSKRATGMAAYIDSSSANGDTLTVAEYNKVITHYNSIKKTLVLPLAASGGNFKFIVNDADSLVIDANASDKIVDGATEYEKQTTVAGTVELIAVDATYWYMVGATGTWTGY